MRVRTLSIGLLVLALLLSAGGTLAGPSGQSGEQTYEGLFSFTYPTNWQLRVSNANQIQLFEDDATITFYGPERVARIRALAPEETDSEFLARFLDNQSLRIIEESSAEGDLLAGGTLQPTSRESGMAYLIEPGPDIQVVTVLRASTKVYADVLPDFETIVDAKIYSIADCISFNRRFRCFF